MKVFALGGYGKTGTEAIKLLAKSNLITEIAVVGRNLKRAEEAAFQIDKKATIIQADGTDKDELITASQGYDIIMNAASNQTVEPSIQAAIRNRVHYCDVSWGDTLSQALQLATEAKAAEITAVIANGISPCISNLMAVHAARQLDEVNQFQIGRAELFNFEKGKELTPHQWEVSPKRSLEELDDYKPFITWRFQKIEKDGVRSILDYQDNQWVEIDPVRKGMDVPLPEGGTVTSFPYQSGDDFFGTLPTDMSKELPVEILFSPLPPQLDIVLREQVMQILKGSIEPQEAVKTFFDMIASNPQKWLTLPEKYQQPTKMWVRGVGQKDGRAAKSDCWFTAHMWRTGDHFLTSAALVAAVLKILRNELREHGVFTAEEIFEPQSFFEEVVAILPDPPPGGRLVRESFEWL
jgi:saccharopine dehydrogenase-like NADP-dependent oxidoreductase